MSTVYVVSITPATDTGESGGFFWHYDQETMQSFYTDEVRHSESNGGTHIVRLVPLMVPDADDDTVTSFIERDRPDEIEATGQKLEDATPDDAYDYLADRRELGFDLDEILDSPAVVDYDEYEA